MFLSIVEHNIANALNSLVELWLKAALNVLVCIAVILWCTVLSSHTSHPRSPLSLRNRWIRFIPMCWKNTCNSPDVWEDWGLWPAVLLKSGRHCSPVWVRMHSDAPAATTKKAVHSFFFLLSHHLSCKYGNSSQLPWQQKQMWRAFSCVMRCELLTSAYKKRNGSNGYGFMSVWAVAILPLTQLGTPYATVCIFYDVGLLTCKEWTIYFAHGLWGFAEEHAHTVCRNYTPINCFFCYFCI